MSESAPTSAVRRRLLLSPLLGLWGAAASARAATLPVAPSLQAELQQALQRRRPLLVMASLEGCPFCRIVRDAHLAPLRAQTGQPVVQLDLGARTPVQDFLGRATTHGELLKGWGVSVTPTVLFFGPGGREVAERLAGASIPDYYGYYLQERLQAAIKSLA